MSFSARVIRVFRLVTAVMECRTVRMIPTNNSVVSNKNLWYHLKVAQRNFCLLKLWHCNTEKHHQLIFTTNNGGTHFYSARCICHKVINVCTHFYYCPTSRGAFAHLVETPLQNQFKIPPHWRRRHVKKWLSPNREKIIQCILCGLLIDWFDQLWRYVNVFRCGYSSAEGRSGRRGLRYREPSVSTTVLRRVPAELGRWRLCDAGQRVSLSVCMTVVFLCIILSIYAKWRIYGPKFFQFHAVFLET